MKKFKQFIHDFVQQYTLQAQLYISFKEAHDIYFKSINNRSFTNYLFKISNFLTKESKIGDQLREIISNNSSKKIYLRVTIKDYNYNLKLKDEIDNMELLYNKTFSFYQFFDKANVIEKLQNFYKENEGQIGYVDNFIDFLKNIKNHKTEQSIINQKLYNLSDDQFFKLLNRVFNYNVVFKNNKKQIDQMLKNDEFHLAQFLGFYNSLQIYYKNNKNIYFIYQNRNKEYDFIEESHRLEYNLDVYQQFIKKLKEHKIYLKEL